MDNNYKNNEYNKDQYNIDDILNDLDDEYMDLDIYSPADNRILESCIEDIEGGDNFTDYCEYIFEMLEEEGYYE